jgi:hypothetical protein
MPIEATKPRSGTRAQLPVSTSSEALIVKGQIYVILRFPYGIGPNLAQTISMVEPMKGRRMLTLKEAREIRDDSESNTAFGHALWPGEWGCVRDPKSEGRSQVAYLLHSKGSGGLCADVYCKPYEFSRVVILKVTSEAATQQDIAGKLRKEQV